MQLFTTFQMRKPVWLQHASILVTSFFICIISELIVYNQAIEYKRQSFLKVVVHVIIIDQCNQTTLD